MTSGMWCSWVEINAKKAEELGIHQGDVIEIASTQGSLRARAGVPESGHRARCRGDAGGAGPHNFTRYATNRGVNPIAILAPTTRRHRHAGVVGDAREDRAGRRTRRQPDSVCGRDARAARRTHG